MVLQSAVFAEQIRRGNDPAFAPGEFLLQLSLVYINVVNQIHSRGIHRHAVLRAIHAV